MAKLITKKLWIASNENAFPPYAYLVAADNIKEAAIAAPEGTTNIGPHKFGKHADNLTDAAGLIIAEGE